METALTPYLNFNGKCREAMEFYERVLGGELTIQTFAEAGMAVEGKRVMHAVLKNGQMSMMASDGKSDQEVVFGDSVHLSLGGTDEQRLTGMFKSLAVGGKVTMKLEKQFWGDRFGMVTDKYGIHWMVNIGHAGPGTKRDV